MKDFVIVEYRGEIGGRVAHTTFGRKADGTPYVVELGANWVNLTVNRSVRPSSNSLLITFMLPGAGFGNTLGS